MYVIQMCGIYTLILSLVLNLYLIRELIIYKKGYKQAIKDGLAIASKRNEAEKLVVDYFKSIKSALRKFNK